MRTTYCLALGLVLCLVCADSVQAQAPTRQPRRPRAGTAPTTPAPRGTLAPAAPKEGAAAPNRKGPPSARSQAALDVEFAQTMSGATLDGSFTSGDPKSLKSDKYTLGKVEKLPNGLWQFNTRIEYGDHDVTVPLALEVKWAGDTPVITLTNVAVPGLGTFTARVLVYKHEYAGTWSGGDHGGHLFGRITHEKSDKSEASDKNDRPHKTEKSERAEKSKKPADSDNEAPKQGDK